MNPFPCITALSFFLFSYSINPGLENLASLLSQSYSITLGLLCKRVLPIILDLRSSPGSSPMMTILAVLSKKK